MKKLRLVRQPVGSKQCGQACMAMICGLKLKEVVEEMGTGGTRTKHLVRFLRAHGFWCESKLQRVSSRWKLYLHIREAYAAVVKITWEKNRSHWVVLHKGRVYDPIARDRKAVYQFPGKATSYLAVWRDPK
jgi:hypothetical protein